MSQFHAIFFEESFEGLDIMESGLLDLNPGEPDLEAINTIFRAAHSIKGGGGTFGFKNISDFTHVMETLLDEMRDGVRDVTQDVTDLLLKSVDVLRMMLEATRDGTDVDDLVVQEIQTQLEAELGNHDASTENAEQTESENNSPKTTGWIIKFHPHDHLYKTGNDPVRIFRELKALGNLEVEVRADELPLFYELDPEISYLSWVLTLETDQDIEVINDIFAWVEDDCDLEIDAIVNEEETQQSNASSNDVVESDKVASSVESNELTNQTPERRTEDRRKTERRSNNNSDNSSIRVNTKKVDALINMVGELVITQSMLGQFGEDFDVKNIERLREGLAQLERNTRELQESVMQIRMLPISFAFNRFPRLVHDLSSKLNKKIELKLSGESTELDKTVMEKIGDPLVHLVRNSLDHGIELPEERVANGKDETGILHLNAYHEGGNIVIEISDDGGGLNTEKILGKAKERGLVAQNETLTDAQVHDLIFQPGFSTADQVSDVSGRGVGMDVVRRNIKDLGGIVEVKSTRGQGSVFTIRLPLTLAILDGQLVRVGSSVYIVPLISIVESLQIDAKSIESIAGQTELYRLREDYIPIVRLYELFNIYDANQELEKGLLVVVESEGQKVGLFIDDLLAQQQVVIKSLETNYEKVEGISGATILGDGQVSLILDISGLHKLYQNKKIIESDDIPMKMVA